jgi:hypothetical protein
MVPAEVLQAMLVVTSWSMSQLGPANLFKSPSTAIRERYLMMLISAGELLPALGSSSTVISSREGRC